MGLFFHLARDFSELFEAMACSGLFLQLLHRGFLVWARFYSLTVCVVGRRLELPHVVDLAQLRVTFRALTFARWHL